MTFSGHDLQTGQLVHITQWKIKYLQLQKNCFKCGNGPICPAHNPASIRTWIEEKLQSYKSIKHKNLINYLACICEEDENVLRIYLIRDFVRGSCADAISKWATGFTYPIVRLIISGLLEALNHLHSNEIPHGNLNASCVYIDESGVCKVADFELFEYLTRLANGSNAPIVKENDLIAVGHLTEQFPNTSGKIKTFIQKCKTSMDLMSLMEHSFLKCVSTSTRLDADYEVRCPPIGSGGFGDVLKVVSCDDWREYAVKRICLSMKYGVNKRSKSEVDILSKLNHPNIVQYIVSWSEIVEKSTFDKYKNIPMQQQEQPGNAVSVEPMDVDTDNKNGLK